MIFYDKFMNNDVEMCLNNILMNFYNIVLNYYLKILLLKKFMI